LAVAPETPATRAPEAVTGVSAVLRGELNPRAKSAEAVEYEFAYAQSASECTGGSVAPEPAEAVAGVPGEEVSREVTNLEPDRTYSVCVVAIRESEVTYGAALQFVTSRVAPVVAGESGIPGLYEARFEGVVDAENVSTACVVEYGATSGYGASVPCEPGVVEGAGKEPVGVTVKGLSPGSAYHFRVVLENTAHEKTYGVDETLTTASLSAPVLESVAATATPFQVMLTADVDPEYQQTTCKVEFSTEPGLGVGSTRVLACTPSLFAPGQVSSGAGPAELTVTGLEPAKSYYYRVVLVNHTGRTEGTVETFKTLALEKPVIESESVPGITPFEATVEAVVNPEYQEASCVVEYSSEESKVLAGKGTKVSCNPADLGSSGGAGGGVAGAAMISGLAAKTTYYYRVLATNASGTTPGTLEHFETLVASAPVIESESVSGVSPAGGTLEAVVNPSFQATTCSFEYSSEESKLTSHKGTKAACPEALAGAGGGVGVAVAAAGLQPSTTYYYRVTAKNTTGTGEGVIEHFETPALERPLIEGENATSITYTTAMLEASVNPEFQATTWQFEYATTEALLLKSEGTVVKGAPPGPDLTGGSGLPVSVPVTGLTPGAVYYYRVLAVNATGTAFEPLTVSRFSTSSVPIAATGEPEAITATTATLTGSVNPEGAATTYSFEYGRTQGYGQHTTPTGLPASTTPAGVKEAIPGLEPGVTYHYRLTATNNSGTQTSYGEDHSFTTPTAGPPPLLTGAAVTATSENTAVITATLQPNSQKTRYELQAGTNPAQLQTQAAGETTTPTILTLTATGLAPSTLYYYRITATSPNGPSNTAEGTFTTTPTTTPTPPITQPTTPPLLPTPTTPFPTPPKPTPPLTNQQKLTKALKTCHKDHSKTKRTKCEKQARHKYPIKKK
jgi:phosphodiesterase/alkaline phosphatase D-like protein